MWRIEALDTKLSLLQRIVGTPAAQHMSDLIDIVQGVRTELSQLYSSEVSHSAETAGCSDMVPDQLCSIEPFKQLLIALGSFAGTQELVLSVLSAQDEVNFASGLHDLSASMNETYYSILRTSCKGCLDRPIDSDADSHANDTVRGEDLLRFALISRNKVPLLSTDDRRRLFHMIASSIFLSANIVCPFCPVLDASDASKMSSALNNTGDMSSASFIQTGMVTGNGQSAVNDVKRMSYDFERKHNSHFIGYDISPTAVNFTASAMRNFQWSAKPAAPKSVQSPNILDVYLRNSIIINENASGASAASGTDTSQQVADSRPVVELSRMSMTATTVADDSLSFPGGTELDSSRPVDLLPVAIPTSAKQQATLSYLSELPIARGITPFTTPGVRRPGDNECSRLEQSTLLNRSPSPMHYPYLVDPASGTLGDMLGINQARANDDSLPFNVETSYATKEVSAVQHNAQSSSVITKERWSKSPGVCTNKESDDNRDPDEVMVSSLSCVAERVAKGASSAGESVKTIKRVEKIPSSELQSSSLPPESELELTSPRQATAIKIRVKCAQEEDPATSCPITSAKLDTQDTGTRRAQDDTAETPSVASPKSISVKITRAKVVTSSDGHSSALPSPSQGPPQEQTYTVKRLPPQVPVKDAPKTSINDSLQITASPASASSHKDVYTIPRSSISYTVSSAILDAIKLNPETAVLKIDSIKIDCSVKDSTLESTISGTLEEGSAKESAQQQSQQEQKQEHHDTAGMAVILEEPPTAYVRDSLSSSLQVVSGTKHQPTASGVSTRLLQSDVLDCSEKFQELTKSVKHQCDEKDRSESPLVSISVHPSNYVSSLPTSPSPQSAHPTSDRAEGNTEKEKEKETEAERNQIESERVQPGSSNSESPTARKSQVHMPLFYDDEMQPQNEDDVVVAAAATAATVDAKANANAAGLDAAIDVKEEAAPKEPAPDPARSQQPGEGEAAGDPVLDASEEPTVITAEHTIHMDSSMEEIHPASASDAKDSPGEQSNKEIVDLKDILKSIGSSLNSRNTSRAVSPQQNKDGGINLAQAIPLLVDMLDATEALIPRSATRASSIMNVEVSVDDINGMSSICDQLIDIDLRPPIPEVPPTDTQDTVLSPSQLEADRMVLLNEVQEGMDDTTSMSQGVNPEDVSTALTAVMAREESKKEESKNTIEQHNLEDSGEEIFIGGTPVTKPKQSTQGKVKRGVCGSKSVSRSSSKATSKAASKASSKSTSHAVSEAPSETTSNAPSVRSSRRLGKLKFTGTASTTEEAPDKQEGGAQEAQPNKKTRKSKSDGATTHQQPE